MCKVEPYLAVKRWRALDSVEVKVYSGLEKRMVEESVTDFGEQIKVLAGVKRSEMGKVFLPIRQRHEPKERK